MLLFAEDMPPRATVITMLATVIILGRFTTSRWSHFAAVYNALMSSALVAK